VSQRDGRAKLLHTDEATKKLKQIQFIDLFKSALHVSGDKLAHPQEHFLTVYTAFGAGW